MSRIHTKFRRGFTLIELLVVITIIIVLASLALVLSPRLSEDQRTVRGADLTSGWLLICKQRAVRDQQARGLRLVRNTSINNNWVTEMVYIERPADYRGGMLTSPSPTQDPAFAHPAATVFVEGKDLTNGGPPNEPIVAAGDYLVFDVIESVKYCSHRVYAVKAVAGGTLVELCSYDGNYPSDVDGNTDAKISAPISRMPSTGFRFVRSPRPMAGEPVLQLPRDIIVDLDTSGATPGPTSMAGLGSANADALDIVFNPSGQAMGTNATAGKVILRVRNSTRPPTDGDQLYVTVYTLSGVIATHPVNLTNSPSWYSFTWDGNLSGF
jgi:prepilin-type N-terminal cleavage/methylation domain-containing protein